MLVDRLMCCSVTNPAEYSLKSVDLLRLQFEETYLTTREQFENMLKGETGENVQYFQNVTHEDIAFICLRV